MKRSSQTLLLMLAILLATAVTAPAQKAAEVLKSSRTKYLKSLHDLSRDYTAKEIVLGEKYQKSLKSLLDQQTSRGNLDYVLAIKNEIAEFRSREPSRLAPPAQASLRKLQTAYASKVNRIETEKSARMTALVNQYRTFLERTERRLTTEGKIDEALLYRKERDRERIIPPRKEGTSPPSQDNVFEEPANESSKLRPEEIKQHLIFSAGKTHLPFPSELIGQASSQMQLFRGASVEQNGLNLQRGFARADQVRGRLLETCRSTGEITLEVLLKTTSINPREPVPIVTFSSGTHQRNFTLEQENRDLKFRLRTSASDLNGLKFAKTLFGIQANQQYHMVLTYAPGQLRCWVDGELVVTSNEVVGNFSNWTEQYLVLGNEHNAQRYWQGHINGITILSRALPEKVVEYAYRDAGINWRPGPLRPGLFDRGGFPKDW